MIITLTTDFGLTDPFVGQMKGVILGIAPEAKIVDITHAVEPFDILEGAHVLSSSCGYFPNGSVHVAVVDPGVGTSRRSIAALSNGHYFVGPDNGLLAPAIASRSGGKPVVVREIQNRSLLRDEISDTFHGRDVFAPLAAHLVRGASFESVGPRLGGYRLLEIPEPVPASPGRLIARVLRVDRFGNILTNLRTSDLAGESWCIRIGNGIQRLCRAYGDAPPGEAVAIEASLGLVEIAMDQASAADRLKVIKGLQFEVEVGVPVA